MEAILGIRVSDAGKYSFERSLESYPLLNKPGVGEGGFP
jgi:hypothetical protein